MNLGKVTLEGTYARLEPLSSSHKSELCDAIHDGALWKFWVTRVLHPDDKEVIR